MVNPGGPLPLPAAAPPIENATPSRWRVFFRWLAAILFIAAGVNHFISPATYERIVPPMFPRADWLVAISGVAEVAGGVGLIIPRLRYAAAWGLIALLIAVFPANIYMALHPDAMPGVSLPTWMLWLRLPLQGVMIAWVWKVRG